MTARRNGAGLWPGRYGACQGRHGFSAVPWPTRFLGAGRAACRQPIGWRLGAAYRRHGRVPDNRPARNRGGGRGKAPTGPCGDAEAPFQAARRSPDGCGRASRPCLSRGARRAAANSPPGVRRQRPPDWWAASGTGGLRCLYGRTVRPGWGNRTPVGLHPAVFETAAFSALPTRRRWRRLPPLSRSFRRVLRHQVKNGGNLLPGNRGDAQAWAFVVRGRLWTRMGDRAAFGAGWPGMVSAIAGAVYRRRIRRREWYRPIGRHGVPPANSPAVMSRRAIVRHGVGGRTWRHPQRDVARDADERPSWRRRWAARYVVPPCWAARCMVPAIAGTVRGGGGRALRSLAGTPRGRPLEPVRRSVGRSPPGNRRAARCPAEFRRASCGAGLLAGVLRRQIA